MDGFHFGDDVGDAQDLIRQVDDQFFVQEFEGGEVELAGFVREEELQKIGQEAMEELFEDAVVGRDG